MPELAEVEFFRKRWDFAAAGERVDDVLIHHQKKLFHGIDGGQFRDALVGATFESSAARAKQMLFRFRRPTGPAKAREVWLGIHLGMTGELSVQPAPYKPGKHDHLVIITAGATLPPRAHRPSAPCARPRPEPTDPRDCAGHALVLNDPRMFGRILFHVGAGAPEWWTRIAPSILSPQFTVKGVSEFLQRRRRAPLKAVLLMQERFPGVGNWMADEILWRAGLHPARAAGSLTPSEIQTLWRECRHVCRLALDTIAGRGDKLPRDLNVNIPRTWLFKHRWRRGGKDPLTGTPLAHATIGGRTTCWSPARQKAQPVAARKTHQAG